MKILIQCALQTPEFRLPDILDSLKVGGFKIEYDEKDTIPLAMETRWKTREKAEEATVFLIGDVESEKAALHLSQRSIVVLRVLELWTIAETFEKLQEKIETLAKEERKNELENLKGHTFKFEFEAVGAKAKNSREKFTLLAPIFKNGTLDIEDSENRFMIIADHTPKQLKIAKQWFFGRRIGENCRSLLHRYTLSTRPFIGTTSMKPILSFLVANQALANKNSIILDPFVGTGSLILSCAHFGAKVIGCDIDIRLLNIEKDKKKNIYQNFAEHKLTQNLVGLFVSDLSQHIWRQEEWLDAIVTDPPYGVRAGARKVGKKPKTEKKYEIFECLKKTVAELKEKIENDQENEALKKELIEKEIELKEMSDTIAHAIEYSKKETHAMQCVAYTVRDSLTDLMNLAARLLRVDGRLVYWLPTSGDFEESHLPRHPCLELICTSEDILTKVLSRRLITMRKKIHFDEKLHANLDENQLGQIGETAQDDIAAKWHNDSNRLSHSKTLGKRKQASSPDKTDNSQ